MLELLSNHCYISRSTAFCVEACPHQGPAEKSTLQKGSRTLVCHEWTKNQTLVPADTQEKWVTVTGHLLLRSTVFCSTQAANQNRYHSQAAWTSQVSTGRAERPLWWNIEMTLTRESSKPTDFTTFSEGCAH